MRRSRRLRDTLAAAPGLLSHACVTETVQFCPMGPKLRHLVVSRCTRAQVAESESLRAENVALKQSLASEHATLTALQQQVAEQAAATDAALSNAAFDLNSTKDALAATQRDASAAQARIIQLQADVKVHQEARKSAESKYQAQLQVNALSVASSG